VEDPNDFSDPQVALGEIDGFSTIEKWVTTFSSFPNEVDPTSVIPGFSVRLFEVSFDFPDIVFVSGIVRELTPGVDFVATMISAEALGIIPLRPLSPSTNYMAVMTNDIHDTVGNDATPSQFYHLSKAQEPWVDIGGIPGIRAPDDFFNGNGGSQCRDSKRRHHPELDGADPVHYPAVEILAQCRQAGADPGCADRDDHCGAGAGRNC